MHIIISWNVSYYIFILFFFCYWYLVLVLHYILNIIRGLLLLLLIFAHQQIEYNDLEATLEKLKSQCPSIELLEAANQSDHFDENIFPVVIKPLNDPSTSSMMDISRLVTHLTRAVVTTRERVAVLLQELHPLKEKMNILQDDYEEKKQVSTSAPWSAMYHVPAIC